MVAIFGETELENRTNHPDPFYGLEDKNGRSDKDGPGRTTRHRDQKDTQQGIQQQDVSVIEQRMQLGKCHQQNHPPHKSPPERNPPPGGIVQLDKKAESEQKGKDGKCLSCQHKPRHVRDSLVNGCQP